MIWTADLFSRCAAFIESHHRGCVSCVLVVRGGEPVPTSIPIHLTRVANGHIDGDQLFSDLGEFAFILRPRATRAALVVHLDGDEDPLILPVPLPRRPASAERPASP